MLRRIQNLEDPEKLRVVFAQGRGVGLCWALSKLISILEGPEIGLSSMQTAGWTLLSQVPMHFPAFGSWECINLCTGIFLVQLISAVLSGGHSDLHLGVKTGA